jgi:ATP-binding cassette, subfamily B, bacterial
MGGRDYTRFTLHAIQSRIGVVLQTPHLFSGTIRENIRYGRLDATDEEVEQAARLAGAHEFIDTLRGYDEEVGEGGNLLSVGRNSSSAWRAVHPGRARDLHHGRSDQLGRHPDRSADPEGHGDLMKGRTSFVIAHRLSTIKRATASW